MGKGQKLVECYNEIKEDNEVKKYGCHKLGNPYFARIRNKKSDKVSYQRYMKHVQKTGRRGEVLQTTCYLGPSTEEEYNNRLGKRIIESIKARRDKTAIIEDLKTNLKILHGKPSWRGRELKTIGKTEFIKIVEDLLS